MFLVSLLVSVTQFLFLVLWFGCPFAAAFIAITLMLNFLTCDSVTSINNDNGGYASSQCL